MIKKPDQRQYVLDAGALIAHEKRDPNVSALFEQPGRPNRDGIAFQDAKRIGELLRESGTTDVADAHVAVLAARLRALVITSDPDDIAKLNAELPLIRV